LLNLVFFSSDLLKWIEKFCFKVTSVRMTSKTFKFDFKDLRPDITRVKELLGYGHGDPEYSIGVLIEEIFSECENIAGIKAEYRIFKEPELNNQEKNIRINGIILNVGPVIFKQLKEAKSVSLFICTAGKDLSTRSRDALKGGDPFRGYIYDLVGSEVTEAAADRMQNSLETELKLSGMNITNRYSPGYCGWDVSEQHKLFHLLPNNYCGIVLTPSALMDPVKSVSGIIGIGSKVRKTAYSCRICDMKECIYREKRL